MNFDAAAIAAATGGTFLAPGQPGPVLTDTRSFRAGGWFLAIVGERFDGHKFIDQVADRAAGLIVSRPVEGFQGGQVVVSDTVVALQDLGRAARRRLSCPVVGITGSNGKTTTRTLMLLALSQRGAIHGTEGNLNNQLGVPMSLLAAPESADAVVIEMGTSMPGEIAFLAELARPSVRLIVNVGPAHLEELGGLAGVAREKGALFRTAEAGDVVVVNLDDPYVAALPIPSGVERVGFGQGGVVSVSRVRLIAESLASEVTFETPIGSLQATLPVPGAHIAQNAAGVLAAAYALGLDLVQAAADMERYEPVGMRLRREDLPNGAVAINDAYNANPGSMCASLEVLSRLPGRRVAVLGDMLELGPDEGRWHSSVATHAESLGLDLVVLVGERMSAAEVPGTVEVWRYPEALSAGPALASWLQEGDHVLFKGSRGARVERVLHFLRERL